MAYIGTKPTVGNFQICDAISVVNGQAAYTMQVGSVNVIPQSANHMICSLNGTIQKPNSSFTVSGSTITFASNLVTNDVIDFIQILGDVLDLGVPSDATVTAAKLNNDIISGTTALTSEPADTDEFLVSDAGTLKRIDYSLIKGGGITVADGWRITTGFNGNGDTFITSGWEQIDDASFGSLGSAMTQSSGVFTFPSTGIYLVQFQMSYHTAINGYVRGRIWITTDNSSYDKVAESIGYLQAGELAAQYSFALVDVTNTSNVKAKFGFAGANASSGAYGSTSDTQTGANFIRLGDT
jgi:hypothetical protein